MPIKTVFAPVISGPENRAAIESAFFLANLYDAHVAGLHVRPDPRSAIPYVGEGMTADVIEELCEAAERDGKARAEEARELFESIAEAENVSIGESLKKGHSASWRETVGDEAEVTAAQARLTDLSVVPRPDDKLKKNVLGVIEAVLLHSGRPTLLVPLSHNVSENRTILIAWNGSAEAARAVAGAMPVLQAADKVIVFTVGELSYERPAPERLVEYLKLYDIEATTETVDNPNREAGEVIVKKAEELGAGLIVTGAYTHSRWRELILGGVTRHLLEKTEIPTLMVH